MSPAQAEVIYHTIKDLLNRGLITKSPSLWSIQIVIVPKKDGLTRMCVDFSRLNSVIRKDTHLPNIEDILLKARDLR